MNDERLQCACALCSPPSPPESSTRNRENAVRVWNWVPSQCSPCQNIDLVIPRSPTYSGVGASTKQLVEHIELGSVSNLEGLGRRLVPFSFFTVEIGDAYEYKLSSLPKLRIIRTALFIVASTKVTGGHVTPVGHDPVWVPYEKLSPPIFLVPWIDYKRIKICMISKISLRLGLNILSETQVPRDLSGTFPPKRRILHHVINSLIHWSAKTRRIYKRFASVVGLIPRWVWIGAAFCCKESFPKAAFRNGILIEQSE